jgi:hypothetical protein
MPWVPLFYLNYIENEFNKVNYLIISRNVKLNLNNLQVKCLKSDSRKGGLANHTRTSPLIQGIRELDALQHEPCYIIGATIIATTDRK